MKVLIIDDNCQVREITKVYLRGVADEIQECCDGVDALSAYTEFLPDWVLMDWEMKQVDGLTATRQIVKEFPDAKILIVTNYDENHLREASRVAGASGYILKDNLLEVRRRIEKIQK